MKLGNLPKVELHCHLDGIITPQIAASIRQAYPEYPIQPEDFAPFFPINDQESFWRWWQVTDPIDGQLKLHQPILLRYIDLLKQQNVRYFEVMIAAGDIPHDPGKAVDAVTELREIVSQHEAGQIQVEFLLAFGRQGSPEYIEAMVNKAFKLYEAGLICGVAMAGKEIGHPVKPFQRHFAEFHEAGLGIEIHAGEWVGAESIWDALEHGYPDRIGHGVTLFDDPKLIEIFQEKQIHIEMCPTSNLKTGSISDIDQHPIRQARDLGLNYSVNTDDPGPFECTMNSEYELLNDRFGFTEDDFMTIYQNSLAARFQPELRVRTD